ncbi:GHKL domain-containing protein [Agreia sp. PsM10]|uniref:GHKL domain-containing protein n=1 Tax=Agreia sp. PsM10 TaxID=3030533 RepID=UPI00263BDCD3|nr:GHKL domain-containing protein [Agreia sp. PsM10]MDN4640766.1 GHKL domain-containing protein [Agreia sp. PsM10]
MMTDILTWFLPAVAVLAVSTLLVFSRIYEARENVRSKRIEAELRSRDAKERDQFLQEILLTQRNTIESLIRETRRSTRSGTSLTDQKEAGQLDTDALNESVALIVREISHSLNTPLSQIEVALSLVAGSKELSSDDRSALARAATSVAISKSFIQAFRIVSGGDMASEVASNEGLAEFVLRAASGLGVSKDHVILDIPTQLDYRSSFILALLVPLIENAVEASPAIDVFVKGTQSRNEISLLVENKFLDEDNAQKSLDPEILTRGFSTKPDHEGLGLAVVQRLVRSVPGAVFTQEVKDGRAMFAVSLPLNPRGLA